MKRILQHLRSQTVGIIALFVALGGTSYAAVNLPSGSVGTSQLRDHSVTPAKLATEARRGTPGPTANVRYWARVRANGKLIAGSPGARSQIAFGPLYTVEWGRRPFAGNCMPFSSVSGAPGVGWAPVSRGGPLRNEVLVSPIVGPANPAPITAYGPASATIDVIVVCPS